MMFRHSRDTTRPPSFSRASSSTRSPPPSIAAISETARVRSRAFASRCTNRTSRGHRSTAVWVKRGRRDGQAFQVKPNVSKSLVLIVPGRLETLTGGYGYDRRIVAGLNGRGWSVTVRELEGDYPFPTQPARGEAAR